MELEGRRDAAKEELDRARSRLAPLLGQRVEAREASRYLNQVLAEVYRDPRAARGELHLRAQGVGMKGAATEMARCPAQFGELHGRQVGPFLSAERRAALETAAKLEHAGARHLGATRTAWEGRHEYRGLRSGVGRLEHRVRDLDGVLAQSPGSAQLKVQIARDLHRLQPHQRQALQRSLPFSKGKILTAALVASHAFAREQGHER